MQNVPTLHFLDLVLLRVVTRLIQPGSVAPWRGQTAQTCWQSSGPGRVWKTQSSEGEREKKKDTNEYAKKKQQQHTTPFSVAKTAAKSMRNIVYSGSVSGCADLWGCRGHRGWRRSRRREQTARQVQRDVVFVAADDPQEVQSQGLQSWVLQSVDLGGNLGGRKAHTLGDVLLCSYCKCFIWVSQPAL